MNPHSQMLQKTSVIYAKTGPAIYHSHHDMIRFWERAVKRARLPLRLTQGFNPRPRIIFPHALGLGITSLHEEVELELHERLDLDELLERVRGAAGDTLEIKDAVALPPVKKSRQIRASTYCIAGWGGAALDALPGIVDSILARAEIVVERGAPDHRRSMDIRPFVGGLRLDRENAALELELVHTLTGSARPDEIAKLAAEAAGIDYHDLSIVKTGMILE